MANKTTVLTSTQKTSNYKERRRSRRAERRERKRAGKNPNNDLAFLHRIIYQLGYTKASFARAIGVSQQLLDYFLLQDNIRLSEIQEWFSRIGLSVTATFIGAGPLPIESDSLNIVWGLGVLPVPRKTGMDNQIRRLATSESRIAFVARLILETGHGAKAFYVKLGVSRTTFRAWLYKGDIRISALYRMAAVTGTKLVWTVDKK